MTLTFSALLAVAAALLLLGLTPGPGVFAVTARAMASGWRPAVGLALGMTFGDLIYASAAIFGLAAIGRVVGEWFILIKMAGAGYIMWLGARMLFQRASQGPAHPAKTAFRGRNFLAGFAICLGNPKVILFYLGFFPAFMDLTRLTGWDALVVLATVALIVGGALFLYIFAAYRAGQIFTGRRFVNGWRKSMGAIMIGAGVWVAAD